MNIIEIARPYIGKKEKRGNSGFEDPQMEKDMREVGWQLGYAWCAGFIEMLAWKAYPEHKDKIKGLFVPSAVSTYRNLMGAGYKRTMFPELGAFVFWQKMEDGNPLWTGHCGVVSEVINSTEFKSIEGNTSDSGSRNGDGVYENHRKVKLDIKDGLKVIGFIKIV